MRDSFLFALLTESAKIIAILALFMAVKVLHGTEETQGVNAGEPIPQVERVTVRSL